MRDALLSSRHLLGLYVLYRFLLFVHRGMFKVFRLLHLYMLLVHDYVGFLLSKSFCLIFHLVLGIQRLVKYAWILAILGVLPNHLDATAF
jgi:hypothetical protein